MTRLKTFIIASLFVVTSCNHSDRENFSLTAKHYGGAAGVTIIYLIDENGLQVDTNCDLANCKQATVYNRPFTKAESDNVLKVLNSLKLDTLKKSYKYQGYYNDGFLTEIKLRKGLFSSHKSTFYNIYTPTADSLNAYIDKLVAKPEFRLATWGQTQ